MESVISSLTALVAEMRVVVDEMCLVLRSEREALDRYDSDALNQASADKTQVLARLDALDAERILMLRAADLDPRQGMNDIEGWLPMLEVLAAGRDLNRENGEIVSQRLRQVRQALAMLNQASASQAGEAGVYGPKGLARQRGTSSTLGKV